MEIYKKSIEAFADYIFTSKNKNLHQYTETNEITTETTKSDDYKRSGIFTVKFEHNLDNETVSLLDNSHEQSITTEDHSKTILIPEKPEYINYSKNKSLYTDIQLKDNESDAATIDEIIAVENSYMSFAESYDEALSKFNSGNLTMDDDFNDNDNIEMSANTNSPFFIKNLTSTNLPASNENFTSITLPSYIENFANMTSPSYIETTTNTILPSYIDNSKNISSTLNIETTTNYPSYSDFQQNTILFNSTSPSLNDTSTALVQSPNYSTFLIYSIMPIFFVIVCIVLFLYEKRKRSNYYLVEYHNDNIDASTDLESSYKKNEKVKLKK